MRWDLFDRLVHFEDSRLSVEFAYDALGRRLSKNSKVHYKQRPAAGSLWNSAEHARLQREHGCGFTLYGWDGDNSGLGKVVLLSRTGRRAALFITCLSPEHSFLSLRRCRIIPLI